RRRAAAPTALHRLAQAGIGRQQLGPERVHHVLRVTLDDRHRRLQAVHEVSLLARLHERGEPTLAEGLDELRWTRERREAAGGAGVDPNLNGLEVLPDQSAQVIAQPADALELEGVRQLVDDDPAEEAVPVDL